MLIYIPQLVFVVLISALCASCPASRHKTASTDVEAGGHKDGFITPYASYIYGNCLRIDLMGGIGSIRAIAFAENKSVITLKKIGYGICTISDASLAQVLNSRKMKIEDEIVKLNAVSIDESLRKAIPSIIDSTNWTYSDTDNTYNLVISGLGDDHLAGLSNNDILLIFIVFGEGYDVYWLPILS